MSTKYVRTVGSLSKKITINIEYNEKGDTFPLDVLSNDTIQILLIRLDDSSQYGKDTDKIHLNEELVLRKPKYYGEGGKIVNVKRKLSDIGISDGTTIKVRSIIHITLKPKDRIVPVYTDTTVGELKDDISKAFGTHVGVQTNKLVLNGEAIPLDDDRSLIPELEDGSVIYVDYTNLVD